MATRSFCEALRRVINEHSQENSSNTPDFVLARFLAQSLDAYNIALHHRTLWHEKDESQAEASFQILARAAVACIVGPGGATGKKRDNLAAALNLPEVQEALGSESTRENAGLVQVEGAQIRGIYRRFFAARRSIAPTASAPIWTGYRPRMWSTRAFTSLVDSSLRLFAPLSAFDLKPWR